MLLCGNLLGRATGGDVDGCRCEVHMADFSLELNEDQLQIQKWVHDFAENVVRPAASEWDEREETPYPLIEEASRIGLYSFDFLMNAFSDQTGLMLPLVNEELFWGDAGIGLSIFGSV